MLYHEKVIKLISSYRTFWENELADHRGPLLLYNNLEFGLFIHLFPKLLIFSVLDVLGPCMNKLKQKGHLLIQ